MSNPIPTLVSYFPKPGHEKQLQSLVERHWPTFHQLGLVTDVPARVWRATDKRDPSKIWFVEMFEWKDEKAPETAHHLPEVNAVWETMGLHMESMTLAGVEALVGT
jgi:hypothetical protein